MLYAIFGLIVVLVVLCLISRGFRRGLFGLLDGLADLFD